jgi:hypothetical protein
MKRKIYHIVFPKVLGYIKQDIGAYHIYLFIENKEFFHKGPYFNVKETATITFDISEYVNDSDLIKLFNWKIINDKNEIIDNKKVIFQEPYIELTYI